MQVGLVGLGILGTPIAERLLSAGMALTVHDVRDEAVAAAVGVGARAAANAAEVAGTSDVVLVCVQTDEQCIDVVEGARGLVAGARPGTATGILSTVHPDTIARLAAACRSVGVGLVDAPLAGMGDEGVRNGTMWSLVGGDDRDVDAVEPALATFTERVLRCGPLGSGAALKLAHNVMVYVGYLGAYEAVELARSAGVRDGLVAEVTRATGALSRQSDVFLDIYERRRRDRGTDAESHAFRTYSALLEKDLRVALDVGRAHGLDLPATELTRPLGDQLYQVGKSTDPRA